MHQTYGFRNDETRSWCCVVHQIKNCYDNNAHISMVCIEKHYIYIYLQGYGDDDI